MKSPPFDFLLLSLVLVFSVVLVPILVSAAKLRVNKMQNTPNLGVVGIQSAQNESAKGVQNGLSASPNEANNAQDSDINRMTDTQQNGIAFCVEPKSLTVKEGEVFNVSVAIENIPVDPGVAGAEFHLSWDTAFLNGLGVLRVMFQDNSIGWDELNNTEGVISYVHSLCSESISGTHTLAIITYEAILQGITTLHFTYVAACSPDSALLNSEAFDGNITVEKGSGTTSQIVSNKPTNGIYNMTIIAGSAIGNNTLILPPAFATLNVPFSVNIEIANVTDMVAWEFGLCWDNSVLNCTNVEIYNPAAWQNILSIDGKIDNNFDSTHGRYHIAVTDSDEPFSRNMTIATLTFNPIGTGTTPLTFNQVDMCNVNCISVAATLSTTIGSIKVNEDT
jgi:hypothetical protein